MGFEGGWEESLRCPRGLNPHVRYERFKTRSKRGEPRRRRREPRRIMRAGPAAMGGGWKKGASRVRGSHTARRRIDLPEAASHLPVRDLNEPAKTESVLSRLLCAIGRFAVPAAARSVVGVVKNGFRGEATQPRLPTTFSRLV